MSSALNYTDRRETIEKIRAAPEGKPDPDGAVLQPSASDQKEMKHAPAVGYLIDFLTVGRYSSRLFPATER